MSADAWRSYAPAGPTIAAFHLCDDLGRFIAGPVGSGKTGGCLNEILYRGKSQAAHPGDGVRRTKFGVIRDTMRELEKTTIPSWLQWVPRSIGKFTGGTGGLPAKHEFGYRLPDQTTMHVVVEFIGLGEQSAENVMPGWEATGAYVNEMDKLSWDTILYVKERIGRFPPVDARVGFAGATWRGIWGDFNKPDTDHWIYQKLVENPEEGFRLFEQPGGMVEIGGRWVLNPQAENLQNLLPGYYQQQVAGAERWRILQRVANRWTASRDGQAVYTEYQDEDHLAAGPIEALRDVVITLGIDAGLDPSCAITQRMADGNWRVVDELVCEHGTGPRRFARELRHLLSTQYPHHWAERRHMIRAWGDPAAAHGQDKKDGEASWLQIVSAELGIQVLPAPSNRLHPRLEAVRRPLSRNRGFLLSTVCKRLRKGFNGLYRYLRRMHAGSTLYSDEPEKNEASHIQDALQYALLGGGENVLMRKPEGAQEENDAGGHVSDYDPYASAA
jgi:hypothetical protein